LCDDLVRTDEQDDFPLRPVTNVIDRAKNDTEKDDLTEEPKHFHYHPEKKIGLETHLANERVAQHDGVDFEVTPHELVLSYFKWKSIP
jgi:hypothetical protein